MPAGLGRRAVVVPARVAICDDDEECTDVGNSRVFLRCMPCNGYGTLRTRFGIEAPQQSICIACRGRGFRMGSLRPSSEAGGGREC